MNEEKEKNQLVKQYVPLIKKISRQLYGKQPGIDYDDIEGFAYEGFALAINNYDTTRSKMTFTQYAAFSIRNAILNGINKYSDSLGISFYKKKQMLIENAVLPTITSLDSIVKNNYNREFGFAGEKQIDKNSTFGFADEILFDNPLKVLIYKVTKKFPNDWADIFFSVYGLNGNITKKQKDIAQEYNISCCLVTKRVQKIIEYIKTDKELINILKDLL